MPRTRFADNHPAGYFSCIRNKGAIEHLLRNIEFCVFAFVTPRASICAMTTAKWAVLPAALPYIRQWHIAPSMPPMELGLEADADI